MISVPRTFAGWVARDACGADPITENLPDRDSTDGSTLTRGRYGSCKDGAEVELDRINGGGHMWPDGLQWDRPTGGDYGITGSRYCPATSLRHSEPGLCRSASHRY